MRSSTGAVSVAILTGGSWSLPTIRRSSCGFSRSFPAIAVSSTHSTQAPICIALRRPRSSTRRSIRWLKSNVILRSGWTSAWFTALVRSALRWWPDWVCPMLRMSCAATLRRIVNSIPICAMRRTGPWASDRRGLLPDVSFVSVMMKTIDSRSRWRSATARTPQSREQAPTFSNAL